MRAPLALVLLMVAFAGCSDGDGRPSAESVAEKAVDQREEDQGPGGDISGADFEIDLHIDETPESPEVEVEATATIEMYRGDAGRIRLRFDEVTLDGDEYPDLAEFDLLLFCSPQRLVLQVTGNLEWGGNDADVETANDADGCFGDDVDEEAMGASIERLAQVVGQGGVAEGFLRTFLEPAPDAEYEVKEAEWDGDQVRATYEVTDEDGEHEESVVIEDGRIVSETMETEEDGVSTTIETNYEYGSRATAPDLRGAEEV